MYTRLRHDVTQVNGRASCKRLLLDDWNEKSAKKLTLKQLSAVMTSLDLQPRVLTSGQVCTSDAVLAEISLRSPRKLLIFIIKKYIYRIKVPEKIVI